MIELVRELERFERDLRPYARTAYARGRRFLNAYLPALITALAAAGPNLTIALVLSTGLSVAVTVLGELDPAIPWSTVMDVLDRRRASHLGTAMGVTQPKDSGT